MGAARVGFAGLVGRWGWAVLCLLGAVGLMAGGWFFIQAHPTMPIQTQGRIADYERITSGSTYVRNDLRLNGDAHTYMLDATLFHPALPAELYQNGRAILWVDQGSSHVVAITLYDQNDANPVKSTTAAYDHPDLAMQGNQQAALLISGAGIALLLGALGWAIVLLRNLQREQPALAGSARIARPRGRR